MADKPLDPHTQLEGWRDRLPEDLRPPDPGSPEGRILAAARRNFSRYGPEATTMRQVAEDAGVNQAMIHYYYGSKSGLYERVLADAVVEVLSSIAMTLTREEGDVVTRLTRLPERIVETLQSDPERLELARREVGAGAPHLGSVIERLSAAGPRGFREVVAALIAGAQAQGAVVDLPPAVIIQFLMIHAWGGLFIEPLMRHAFEAGDVEGFLSTALQSQRTLVRRALVTTTDKERK